MWRRWESGQSIGVSGERLSRDDFDAALKSFAHLVGPLWVRLVGYSQWGKPMKAAVRQWVGSCQWVGGLRSEHFSLKGWDVSVWNRRECVSEKTTLSSGTLVQGKGSWSGDEYINKSFQFHYRWNKQLKNTIVINIVICIVSQIIMWRMHLN